MSEAVLTAEGLNKVYPSPAGDVHVLHDIALDLHPGELVVLRGPSGAGKTTLLNLLGGLDVPSSGSIRIDGAEVTALSEDDLAAVRQTRLGHIFQSFGLISVLSAAENVDLALRIQGMAGPERRARVEEVLGLVGLAEHAQQRPYELSGGQQQRVGIARALAGRPAILLADEPTGQLDSGTAEVVMDLIADLVHSQGVAALVSTHDPLMLSRADRVIELHDGRIASPRGRHAAASAG